MGSYTRPVVAELISFARGAPSADLLPVEAVREAAAKALTDDAKVALSYGTGLGMSGSASGSPSGMAATAPGG